MTVFSARHSSVAKLGAYAAVLGLVLAAGAVVGAAVGPDPSSDHSTHTAASATTATMSMAMPSSAAGLAISEDGYTLRLDTPTVSGGAPAELRFAIIGPTGDPVTAFDVAHDKQLHLVVVSRDLHTYAHLHPDRDAAGTWRVTGPVLPAGSYRVFADFVPTGHAGLTLGADMSVPGRYEPRPVPAPSRTVRVDGFDVTFDGELVAGRDSTLAVTVTRDGRPVADLQPYLGALGHLVAIRDGDLAYLHVHPLDDAAGPGGPTVRFALDVPTAGTYGLFFDFSHDGTVRDASVTAVGAAAASTTPATPAGTGHEGHG